MKKMISCLTALAMLTATPVASVFAADTTTVLTATADEKEAAKDEIAVAKMNDMNVIISLTEGATGVLANYIKVEDERFKTIDSVKAFIKDTCTGQLRDKLLKDCDTCLLEKDGALYKKGSGRFFFTFVTRGGATVLDPAMNRFAAITKQKDQMNDYGKAEFIYEDGKWKISNYEFGFFTENKSPEDLSSAAYGRIIVLGSILAFLAKGADFNAKDNITIDGVEYGKAEYQNMNIKYVQDCIEETCTGELEKALLTMLSGHIIEIDGVVYVRAGGKGAPDFNLSNGVDLLSTSDNGYKVVTTDSSQLSGYGIFELAADEGEWRISDYTVSYFPEERLFGGSVAVDSGTLNLRSEPNTSSKILGSLPNGTQLDIYACDTKGWYKTIYNGIVGYVSADYIKEIDGYYKAGDANCDKTVDLSDAVMVMQALANPNKYGLNGSEKTHITAQGIKNADVIGNNGMTTEDAGVIQRYLLHSISELPVKN